MVPVILTEYRYDSNFTSSCIIIYLHKNEKCKHKENKTILIPNMFILQYIGQQHRLYLESNQERKPFKHFKNICI